MFGTPLTSPLKTTPAQKRESDSQTEEGNVAIEQKPLVEILDDELEIENSTVVADEPVKQETQKAKNGWVGRRAGLVQKKIVGAKRCTFMLTDEQAEKVSAFVKQLRSVNIDDVGVKRYLKYALR